MFSETRESAAVTLRVEPGPLTRIDHVVLAGLEATRDEVVLRELRVAEGERLGLGDVIESQRRLASLGLFERVSVSEIDPESVATRSVVVALREAPRTTIAYGLGWAEQDRLRASLELTRRNLGGWDRSLSGFVRGSGVDASLAVKRLSSAGPARPGRRTRSTCRSMSNAGSGCHQPPAVSSTGIVVRLAGESELCPCKRRQGFVVPLPGGERGSVVQRPRPQLARRAVRRLERPAEPGTSLRQRPTRLPELFQADRELEREHRPIRAQSPRERRSQVVPLSRQTLERQRIGSRRRVVRATSQTEAPVGVRTPDDIRLVTRFEHPLGVFPDRIEHPEPVRASTKQALVEERVEGVDLCSHDFLGAIARASSGEDGGAGTAPGTVVDTKLGYALANGLYVTRIAFGQAIETCLDSRPRPQIAQPVEPPHKPIGLAKFDHRKNVATRLHHVNSRSTPYGHWNRVADAQRSR